MCLLASAHMPEAHMAVHSYLLPVCPTDKSIWVMLGKKKLMQTRLHGHAVTGDDLRGLKSHMQVRGNIIPNYAGQWVVIGGAVDDEVRVNGKPEQAYQAGYREFLEETGADLLRNFDTSRYMMGVEVGGLWYGVIVKVGRIDELQTAITQNIAKGAVTDDEIECVEWMSITDAINRVNTRAPVAAEYQARGYKTREWFSLLLQKVDQKPTDNRFR
jgi:8-oxo-dGTP pyrophosphatase MutT (NUDIX family)